MQTASDPFDLQPFVDAQARVYPKVLDELLGPRLRECTRTVNAAQGHMIREISGRPTT